MKLQITRHMMNKKYFTKLLWNFSIVLVRGPMVWVV